MSKTTVAVDNQVAPAAPESSGLAATDTSAVGSAEANAKEGSSSATPDNNKSQPPANGPTDISVYQDIVAKYNKDNTYQMSAKEADIYLSVQEKVNSGQIKEPPLKGNETPPEKKPAEEGKKEDGTEPEANADGKKLGDTDYDLTYEAMKKVGAKDVKELPAKIDSLLKMVSGSGERLGKENVQLKERLTSFETKAQNHNQWVADLKAGKPEAIEHLVKDIGFNVDSLKSRPQQGRSNSDQSVPSLENMDEFLDDKLASVVKGLYAKIEQQSQQLSDLTNKDKSRADQMIESQAVTGWVDDVVKVVTSDSALTMFGLNASEARQLAERYFDRNDNGPVHPKFQKVHELISYAHKNKMPNLQSALVLMRHESGDFLKQATEAARKATTNQFKPSVNSELSEKHSRAGNNIPDPTITDDVLDKIERGGFRDIPDEWMDEKTGNLIMSKIPQRFHARLKSKAQMV